MEPMEDALFSAARVTFALRAFKSFVIYLQSAPVQHFWKDLSQYPEEIIQYYDWGIIYDDLFVSDGRGGGRMTPQCKKALTKIFLLLVETAAQDLRRVARTANDSEGILDDSDEKRPEKEVNDLSPEAIARRVAIYKVLAGVRKKNSSAVDRWVEESQADLQGFLKMHHDLLLDSVNRGKDLGPKRRHDQTMSVLYKSQMFYDIDLQPSPFLVGYPYFRTRRGPKDEGLFLVVDHTVEEFLRESFHSIMETYNDETEREIELSRCVELFRGMSWRLSREYFVPNTADDFVRQCIHPYNGYMQTYAALVRMGFPPFQARLDEVIQRLWQFILAPPWRLFGIVPPGPLLILETRRIARSCGPETLAKDYMKFDFTEESDEQRAYREEKRLRKLKRAGFNRFLRFSSVICFAAFFGPFTPTTTSFMIACIL